MKNIVCIVCPRGCRVDISKDDSAERGYIVQGTGCKRGIDYAIKEVSDPRRMIPTTVKILGAPLNRLPVITSEPVPKDLIFKCMEVINAIEVTAPVRVNEVLYRDILGTGVDIIATRSMNTV